MCVLCFQQEKILISKKYLTIFDSKTVRIRMRCLSAACPVYTFIKRTGSVIKKKNQKYFSIVH